MPLFPTDKEQIEYLDRNDVAIRTRFAVLHDAFVKDYEQMIADCPMVFL